MKRDFNLLDAQRFYKSDSFDFVVESNGIYDNEDIIRRACIVMQTKIRRFVENLEAAEIVIEESHLRPDRRNSTMENSYDVVIPGEDYTLGCVLSTTTYQMFFEKARMLTFCGFIKFHPHDKEVVLRLAFAEPTERPAIQTCLIQSCRAAAEVFQSVEGMMTRRGPR
jgi:DNA-directed RNA polymerase subunit L